MAGNYRRCIRCLMPSSYPGTWFNKDGICNQCIEFKKKELLDQKLLVRKLSSRQGDEYDCVLGISGGRDSSYVAYLARKRFNLRTLAVFYDSPFYCDLARKNINNVCNTLDIDLVIVKSKNNLEYNLLYNHLMSVASTGTSWGQCIFCHYGIDAILFNIAQKKNIPFILSGVTHHELWNPCNRTKILFQRLKKLQKKDLLMFIYYQVKAYRLLVSQRREFYLPSNSIFNVYKRAKLHPDGANIIRIFDYIDWNFKEIEKTLTESAGWTKPDKSISWRYDCILESLLDYTYKKEFGITTIGIYLSSLIRHGQIQRDEALKIFTECENEDVLRDKVEYVLDYLRFPESIKGKFFHTEH